MQSNKSVIFTWKAILQALTLMQFMGQFLHLAFLIHASMKNVRQRSAIAS